MRQIVVLILFIIVTSCAANKGSQNEVKEFIPPPLINCPEGGDCTFQVLKDSGIKLATDNTGKLYPEIIAGDKIVVKFEYKKDEIEGVMDAGLTEYVYLEFDPEQQQILLKDKELQKVKMIYGKVCFCSDMGYYRVKQGSLFLFNREGNLQIRSSFKVSKVRQVISEIDENINY